MIDVDLSDRNPTLQLLLKELEKKLGEETFEVHSLRNNLNVIMLSRSGNLGTRISVAAAQTKGCYSIQVRVTDDSIPLMGIDIPVDATKMSLEQTLEILSAYLCPKT
jgi:hypothetical protein